jgi:hypothetical protein
MESEIERRRHRCARKVALALVCQRGEGSMKKAMISLLALLSWNGVSNAATYSTPAMTYYYSYTFDLGTTISGSFSGIAMGDLNQARQPSTRDGAGDFDATRKLTRRHRGITLEEMISAPAGDKLRTNEGISDDLKSNIQVRECLNLGCGGKKRSF